MSGTRFQRDGDCPQQKLLFNSGMRQLSKDTVAIGESVANADDMLPIYSTCPALVVAMTTRDS